MSEMTEENQRLATPEETLDILIQCLPKAPFRDRVTEAVADLRAQLAAATKRIEEAEKCEPYAFEVKHPDGCTELVYPAAVFKYRAFPDEWISQNLYTRPVPPADVADEVARWKEAAADLGRCFDSANKRIRELEQQLREAFPLADTLWAKDKRIAELERKLAEQQAKLDTVRSLFIGGENLSPRERAAFDALRGDTYRELNTLLAQARKDAVPEGWRLLKDTTYAERSWEEDSAHENGHYLNTCCNCGRDFTGHKRRVVCKSCAMLAAAPSPANAKEEL